jgi:hypothetical protein
MQQFIYFSQGSDYKKYDFDVLGEDFIFKVPYMLSGDGKRFYGHETTVTIENGVNMTHVQLVTEFSKKIEELKDGYLLG